MPSLAISIAEIEALLLRELRKVDGCAGARAVTINPRPPGDDWICGAIQAGDADLTTCRVALVGIEKRLRATYRLTVPQKKADR